MKGFFKFIILAVVCGSSAVSAAAADYETCLARVNEMSKGFAPAEPIGELVSKLETTLNLQRVVELYLGANSNYNTKVLRYAVALDEPEECSQVNEQYEKMRREDTCMGELSWMKAAPKDKLMEGHFGRHLRALFACFLTRTVQFPNFMDSYLPANDY